jgi:hypothetical protein
MFALNSDITIGQYGMKPHDVRVQKSIYEYVDKATIKLPISARIKNTNSLDDTFSIVETAKQFKAGDKVIIKLGYNGALETEFEGFVRRINFTSPVEVECEGYSYQLRIQSYKKTFTHVQLLDVLKYLVQGTDIILDEKNIPAFKIDKLCLTGANGCKALEEIKKISHNIIQIFFTGNRLWAGLIFLNATGSVENYPTKQLVHYRLGWNVIKDNNLKQRESNGDVVMVYEGIKKDGTKEKAIVNGKVHKVNAKVVQSSGGAGMNKTVRTHSITDAATLKNMALAAQYKFNYDGYEGKITAFLQPFCQPAYMAFLEDLKYPERTGTYNVESTDVTYGMKGARRIVGIGIKLK